MASLSNPAQVGDSSFVLTGTAVGVACPANPNRSFLMIQGLAGMVFSFTNPNPVAGAGGCFTLGTSGGPLMFGPVVPGNAIYVGGSAGTFAITQG
jgi:hypothetical protein